MTDDELTEFLRYLAETYERSVAAAERQAAAVEWIADILAEAANDGD